MAELSEEQMLEALMARIGGIVEYWNRTSEPDSAGWSQRYRLGGVAFSILALLDGANIGVPAFIVAPRPHPDDQAYHAEQGEDWWPDNSAVADSVKGDLAGGLHEAWAAYRRE